MLNTLSGVMPIVSTPFGSDSSIDTVSLDRLVRYMVDCGVDGVVYPGIASEFQTLSCSERKKAVDIVAAAVMDVPLIVGIASAAGSTEESVFWARQAADIGAAAVMMMPPPSIEGGTEGLVSALEKIGELGPPIIFQNAPAPLGPAFDIDTMIKIVAAVGAVQYVKEETQPTGPRITALLESRTANLKGVFGGAGGRCVMDELNRGATGYMPACEVCEAHVALMRSFWDGDRERARAHFNALLPLLNMGGIYRTPVTKAVLASRGLIESEHFRDHNPQLDAFDRAELDQAVKALGHKLT